METARARKEEYEEEERSEFECWFEAASDEEILEHVASILQMRDRLRMRNTLRLGLEFVDSVLEEREKAEGYEPTKEETHGSK